MKLPYKIVIKFGLVVSHERKKLKISQEELADRVGVHRTYVGMIERGEKNITLVNIERFAKGLKMPISTLIRKVENHRGT